MDGHDPQPSPHRDIAPSRGDTGIGSTGRPPAEHVLAVYGTLRPGESNFDVVSGIGGRWYTGTIGGRLFAKASGPYRGYPAVSLDPDAGRVPVAFLVSDELPGHWDRLDEFEGPGYRRVVVEVSSDPASGAPLAHYRANVYEVVVP
jgi:gamma-glutamylcyclotransferase (GGCT)/AIG2-like uncharacterized protein YtfP